MIQRLGEPSEALRHVPPPFSWEETMRGPMVPALPPQRPSALGLCQNLKCYDGQRHTG